MFRSEDPPLSLPSLYHPVWDREDPFSFLPGSELYDAYAVYRKFGHRFPCPRVSVNRIVTPRQAFLLTEKDRLFGVVSSGWGWWCECGVYVPKGDLRHGCVRSVDSFLTGKLQVSVITTDTQLAVLRVGKYFINGTLVPSASWFFLDSFLRTLTWHIAVLLRTHSSSLVTPFPDEMWNLALKILSFVPWNSWDLAGTSQVNPCYDVSFSKLRANGIQCGSDPLSRPWPKLFHRFLSERPGGKQNQLV